MAQQILAAGGMEQVPQARGLWSDAFRRLRKNRLALASIVLLLALALVAGSAAWLPAVSRFDSAQDQDYKARQDAPTASHFFGTDNLGRDNWSRVLQGIRISLLVGLGAQAVSLVIGLLVGAG